MSEEIKEEHSLKDESEESTAQSDESPLKPKRVYKLTPAREATLRRGREKRAENVKALRLAKELARDEMRNMEEKIRDTILEEKKRVADQAPPPVPVADRPGDPYLIWL